MKIHWYTSHIFGIRQIWVWILALFLSNLVTLVVLTFEPQCPHLQNGDNKVSMKLFWDKMTECTYTYLCTELSNWCFQMVATNSRQFFKGQMLQVKHIGFFIILSFFLSKSYVYVINWMTARSGFLSCLEEGKRKWSQLKLRGGGGCVWISNSPGKMCGLVHQRVPEPGRQQMAHSSLSPSPGPQSTRRSQPDSSEAEDLTYYFCKWKSTYTQCRTKQTLTPKILVKVHTLYYVHCWKGRPPGKTPALALCS